MPLQYINELLELPELQIHNVLSMDSQEVHFEASPITYTQACPICLSEQYVKRDGRNNPRKVRHLNIFGKKSYFHIPSIRLSCTRCQIGFVWNYEFVGPKQRYSLAFRAETVAHALGSTAAHSARMQRTPTSTVQRMHQDALPIECERLTNEAWRQAHQTSDLVLGIDDFAIRKGHTYNTGIHDLRGEMMLDLLPGRTLEDLNMYMHKNPHFLTLNPKAVVMDLAKTYHTWIKACFPNAIRIADRFHFHGYVIKSVQEVRKTVQRTLSPHARMLLKRHHRLLHPPVDQLSESCREQLEILLSFSPLLRSAWEWKEVFTAWYDYSPDVHQAQVGFLRWIEQGMKIDHAAVRTTLNTMNNWRDEIINYHKCRWTNATVEGRHNRIKAYQRRHYFTRNQTCYKKGILVECNRLRLLN